MPQSPLLRMLRNLRHRIFQAIEGLIFALVMTILALVFTQVFTRYVLHVPVNWLEEAARMALVWLVMLGAALAAERREHYVINIIVHQLPVPIALATLLLTNVLGIAFLVVLTIQGLEYFKNGLSSYYVSLNVPRGYIYIAVPIGAVLMAFSLVTQSVEGWLRPAGIRGGEGGTPETEAPALPHE